MRGLERIVLLVVLSGATAALGSPAAGAGSASSSTCFGRSDPGTYPLVNTPLTFPATARRQAPKALLRVVRARFGDTTFIRGAGFGPIPRVTRMHSGYFGATRPPANGVWLYVSDPEAIEPRVEAGTKTPDATLVARQSKARLEAYLFAGAVRDELCLHGTRPFVGWTLNNRFTGFVSVSDLAQPFAQRFPNLSDAALRRNLNTLAGRYRFSVQSVTYLHPYQRVPVVVLRTHEPAVFAGNSQAILNSFGIRGSRPSFEGYYVEVRGDRGPFLIWSGTWRGIAYGSFYCAARISSCPHGDFIGPKKH